MTGQQHSSGSSSREPRDGESSVRRGDSLPRHLLEEVLRCTSDALDPQTVPVGNELQALRQVARKHAGRPLELDPVLIDLVRAMLDRDFCALLTPEECEPMARCIAESLYDDPDARSRVDRLWKQLSADAV